MIKSMTGFGKSEVILPQHKLSVEIRCLNSKQLDLNLKIPQAYREWEHWVRTECSKKLLRGKVDVSVYLDFASGESPYSLNTALALEYYAALQALGEQIGHPPGDQSLSLILKMPDVLKAEKDLPDEEGQAQFKLAVTEALKQVDIFRVQEAQALEADLRHRVGLILEGLEKVTAMDGRRLENVKEKLRKALAQLPEGINADENRFEQELIYYLEKLDITEEKVRLTKHCAYFLETLDAPDSEGKKLGFITQEMGREINTIGSKANDHDLQRIVVGMKDELEKIKEQLFNIL